MSPEWLIAFVLFAVAASITPGPNNTMLMASGANFGIRRSIPHMSGVVLGFGFLLLCVGAGLGGLLTAFPVLQGVLWAAGTIYLLYLAWKIASSRAIGISGRDRPMTFVEAVAFQWVNPKAWTGALGAFSAFAPPGQLVAGIVAISIIFLVVNIPVVLLWSSAGAFLRRFLEQERRLRAFNIAMAILLVLSLIPPAMERMTGGL
jgi:threonine/homoserine/homoserine lactone efflux protein